MSNNKLVSIALTTYNGEKYLREQLDSIFNQTYKNLEVVVTDDCSSDGTLEILEKYSQNHNLRYFVNEKNLGFSKNFEKAISLCKGDYIALCDQDDIWLPEKIETLVNEIGTNSLIFSDASLIDSQGNIYAGSFNRSSCFLADNQTSFLELIFRKYVYGCTALFKKELTSKAMPIPESFQHDWWLPLIACKTDGIKYIDKPLLLYRQHESNQIGASKDGNLLKKIVRYFFSKDQRENRNRRRHKLKKLAELTLQTKIPLSNKEKTTLSEIIRYYNSFSKPTFSLNILRVPFKHKNILFDKSYYPYMDVLGYVLFKA